MTDDILKIIELLKDKKALFLSFEQETEAVFSAPGPDEIIEHMEARQKLLGRAQHLDGQISHLLSQCDPEAEDAICNRCGRGKLSCELAALYDASMEVKAVANRIRANDGAVLSYLESQKADILKKLEELNKSPSAAANKYSFAMRSASSRPFSNRSLGKA